MSVTINPNPLEVWACLTPDRSIRLDEPYSNAEYLSVKELRLAQSLLQLSIVAIDKEIRDRELEK